MSVRTVSMTEMYLLVACGEEVKRLDLEGVDAAEVDDVEGLVEFWSLDCCRPVLLSRGPPIQSLNMLRAS